MAIKITLNNIRASENSSLFNNARIKTSDAEITVSDMIISGNSKVLDDLDIDEVRDNIYEQLLKMDKNSSEYSFAQKLLSENKSSFKSKLIDHVKSFAEGIVANVVTNLLTK